MDDSEARIVPLGRLANELSKSLDSPAQLFQLEINIRGKGVGTVNRMPDRTAYSKGQVVRLTAEPGVGSRFVRWMYDATGAEPVCNVTMTKARCLFAEFELMEERTPTGSTTDRQLEKRVGHQDVFIDHGDGTVTDTRSGLMWMRCSLGQSWNGSKCIGFPDYIKLNLPLALPISFSGHNDWRLPNLDELKSIVHQSRKSPAIDTDVFPGTGKNTYWTSSSYDASHIWQIDFESGNINISQALASAYIRLVRDTEPFILSVTSIGAGSGVIVRNTNTTNYLDRRNVKLTARANQGSKFKCWHGDASGSDPIFLVVMNSDKIISAEFSKSEYFSLDTQIEGTGSGSVIRSLDLEKYSDDTVLTLTARANKGSEFKCWHGDASGRKTTSKVTMDSAKKVSAEFVALESYQLDVTAIGTGCGSTYRSIYSPSYFAGTKVTLTALADEGSVFNGWHGDVSMTDEAIIVTMSSAYSISAEFVALESFALDVAATGTGCGKIDRSIDLPSYFADTEVTLTALAEEGSIFNGWHGDIAMMDESIVVTMNSAYSISAEFVQLDIADTEITAELVSTTKSEVKRGQTATVFRLMLNNNGEQQVRVKVPLTSYVSQSSQTSEQNSWTAGLVNGSKGITLSAGAFCEMGLVHFTQPAKGDRLYVTVDQIQPTARMCFTFQCIGEWDDFLLISASLVNPSEATATKATQPVMASALKRIESLESTLAEVLHRLDAIQQSLPMAGRNSPSSQAGPVQTLTEVLAWVAENDQITVAELRARLLPLDLLPNAVIDDVNERAYDLAGEAALDNSGDAVIVQRGVLLQVLAARDE